jgi:hypothetical protein
MKIRARRIDNPEQRAAQELVALLAGVHELDQRHSILERHGHTTIEFYRARYWLREGCPESFDWRTGHTRSP